MSTQNLYMNVRRNIVISAKQWEQPKCLCSGAWMNKVWSDHAVEWLLSNKKEGGTNTGTTWISCETMMPGE